MTRGLTMYVTLRLANEDRVNHMYIEICVCFLVWVKTWCHVLAGFVAATAAALECVHTYMLIDLHQDVLGCGAGRWLPILLSMCVVSRDGGFVFRPRAWYRSVEVSFWHMMES